MRNYLNSIGDTKVWLTVAVLTALLLSILCGCDDDTSTMAQQMGSARPGSSVNSRSQVNPSNTTTPPPATAAPDQAQPCGDATPEAGAEMVDGEYVGPTVLTDKLTVDAPYPEFNGEGRYDISVNVHTEEPVEGGVWDIILYNENDEEVGKQQQFLVIPSTIPKSLVFYAFYCKNMPSKIEFRLTNKEAVVAGTGAEGEAGEAGKRGMAGAGGGMTGGGASDRSGGSGGMDRGAGTGGGDGGGEEEEDL